MSDAKKKVRKIFIESLSEIGNKNSWIDSIVAIWPSNSWDNNTRNRKYVMNKYNVKLPKKWKTYTIKILCDYFMEILDIYVNDRVDPDCPSKLLSIKTWATSIKSQSNFARSDKTFKTFVNNLHDFTKTYSCNIFHTHKPVKHFTAHKHKKQRAKIYSPVLPSRTTSPQSSSMSTVSPLFDHHSRSTDRFDYITFLESTSLSEDQRKKLQTVASMLFRLGPVASFAYIHEIGVEGDTRKGFLMFWRHLILYLFSNFRLASACSAINNLAFQLRNSMDERYDIEWSQLYPELNMKEFTTEFQRVKDECVAITCSVEAAKRRSSNALIYETRKSPGITCRNPSKLKHALTEWESKILRAVPGFKTAYDMDEWIDRFIERARQKIKTDTTGAGWKGEGYDTDEDDDEYFSTCPRTTELDRLSEIVRDRISNIEKIQMEFVTLVAIKNINLDDYPINMDNIATSYQRITECQDKLYYARAKDLKECLDSTKDEYETTMEELNKHLELFKRTHDNTHGTASSSSSRGWRSYISNMLKPMWSTVAGLATGLYRKVTSYEKTKWIKLTLSTAFIIICMNYFGIFPGFTALLYNLASYIVMILVLLIIRKFMNTHTGIIMLLGYSLYQGPSISAAIYLVHQLISIFMTTQSPYLNFFMPESTITVPHAPPASQGGGFFSGLTSFRSWKTDQKHKIPIELTKRLNIASNVQGDEKILCDIFMKNDVNMICDPPNGLCYFEIDSAKTDLSDIQRLGFKITSHKTDDTTKARVLKTISNNPLLRNVFPTPNPHEDSLHIEHNIAVLGLDIDNKRIKRVFGVNSKGLLFKSLFDKTGFLNNVKLENIHMRSYGSQADTELKSKKRSDVTLQDVLTKNVGTVAKRHVSAHTYDTDALDKMYNIVKQQNSWKQYLTDIEKYASYVGIENKFKHIGGGDKCKKVTSLYVSMNDDNSIIPSEHILNQACLSLFALDALNNDQHGNIKDAEDVKTTRIMNTVQSMHSIEDYSCSDAELVKEYGETEVFGGLKLKHVMVPKNIAIILYWKECLIAYKNNNTLTRTQQLNTTYKTNYEQARSMFQDAFGKTPEQWLGVQEKQKPSFWW